MKTHARTRVLLPAIGMLAVGSLSFAACVSDDSLSSGDSVGPSHSRESQERPDRDAVAPGTEAPASEDGAADSAGREATGEPGEEAVASASVVKQQAVIAKATLELSHEDVGAARRDVQRVVDRLSGTVADEETATDPDGLTWSRLVLRVPSADFEEAIGQLEEVGTLQRIDRDTEDVSTQVIDTQARIRAQERALRRIEQLLGDADRLSDVISIESELTRRQSDLDSLKQQRAWLADQTSFSTLTVHLERVDRVEEAQGEEQETAGFLVGLRSGWDALSGTGLVLATVLGALLPWLPVVAVGAGLLWWLVRRARIRTDRPTTGAPAPAA